MADFAAAKLGDERAERLYYSKNGRGKLEEAVLRSVKPWLARDFRGHTSLIAMWREQSAHAHEATVSEGEAYMALRSLVRFATLVTEQWDVLCAADESAPAD